MNFKAIIMIVIMAIVVFSVIDARVIVKRSPTCPEPTCGGTREVGGQKDAGKGGDEEEDANCAELSTWNNYYAWKQHCIDGSVGAYKDPPGRGNIGTPKKEEETV